MPFVVEPLFGQDRLFEFLKKHLADRQWIEFRAAVAFVKRSGTQRICDDLRHFSKRAKVKLTVGTALNTSSEGLSDLLQCTRPGQVFVYGAANCTFHPKVYLFKSDHQADVIVGSGNLTGGGIFDNFEAFLSVSLDLNSPALQSIEKTLDSWSAEQEGRCYLLTKKFLKDELVARGRVLSEKELAVAGKGQKEQVPPLFRPVDVPRRPPLPAAQTRIAPKVGREAVEIPRVVTVPPPATTPTQVAANGVVAEGNTELAVGKFAQFVCPKTETGIPLWGEILWTSSRKDELGQVTFRLLQAHPKTRNYKRVREPHVTTRKFVVHESVSATPPTKMDLIRQFLEHLKRTTKRDRREPPDPKRRGRFRAGWNAFERKKKRYANKTMSVITWTNLGNRFAQQFSSSESWDSVYNRIVELES